MNIQENKTLLQHFNILEQKMPANSALAIIDAICINHYPKPDSKFQKEIIDFTNYFKKKYSKEFIHNQDTIVFRLFEEITQKAVEKKVIEIHESLTKQQQKEAKNLAQKIFKFKKDMFYAISAGGHSYVDMLTSEKRLSEMLEYMLYCKNGVIVFNGMFDNKKCAFGFKNDENLFIEIKKEELQKLSNKNDINYITYSELIT